mmetsp:Transcript_53596/g.171767  ORF Transcript_53596/g.171767 Transcript_53596/m.171767 type:complete len:227 (+) Transcript_53596:88-768(+)
MRDHLYRALRPAPARPPQPCCFVSRWVGGESMLGASKSRKTSNIGSLASSVLAVSLRPLRCLPVAVHAIQPSASASLLCPPLALIHNWERLPDATIWQTSPQNNRSHLPARLYSEMAAGLPCSCEGHVDYVLGVRRGGEVRRATPPRTSPQKKSLGPSAFAREVMTNCFLARYVFRASSACGERCASWSYRDRGSTAQRDGCAAASRPGCIIDPLKPTSVRNGPTQ